jgi:phosphotriesterase-related protein
MQRRDFLKLATSSAGILLSAPSASGSPIPPRIMTVLGPVPAGSLGRTLMHEHVLVDFVGADKIAPGRYDPEEVFQKALPHLQKLKSVGCGTLVECTPAYLGRDPELLRRLSRASGLHIITNTGFYGAGHNKFLPEFAFSETAEQLAARWTREFEEGIAPTGIRPGLIKTGVEHGPLSETHAKLLSAAALTHLRTGLVIASHTGNGTAALAQLALLKERGVRPSAFIWVHAQNELATATHLEAAKQGAWVEFDGIPDKKFDRHIDLLLQMKEAGFLNRVLISRDAGWYHVGEPGGGEYRGYHSLFTEFLPAARKEGLSEDDSQTLLVRNPRRALSPSRQGKKSDLQT